MKKVLSLLTLLALAHTLSAKPAALVNTDGYGKSDSSFMINRVLHPKRIAYKLFDKFPAAELEKFASVWVFSTCNALSEEEIKLLKEYVNNGGLLVLTGGAVRGLTGAKFAKSDFNYYKIVKMNRQPKLQLGIMQKNHPLFAGIDPDKPVHFFNKSRFLVEPLPPTTILAGAGKLGTVTENRIGKGAIYYLWDAHFFTGRLANENFPVMDTLFSNLLKMRKHSTFAEDLQANHPGKNLLIWQRKWNRWPQERPHFDPNYPLPGEEITKLEFFSAIDERDTRFFVIQSPQAMEIDLSLSGRNFTLLRMSKAAPLPKRLRKGQDKAWADAEGNYFLREFSGKITLLPGMTEVFAIRADTAELAPGKYNGELRCNELKIPLSMTVYPVMLGRQRPISYRTWGSTMPLTDAGSAMLKLHNIRQAGIPFTRTTNIKLKGTQRTFHVAMWKNRKMLDSGVFPELDFPETYPQYARRMAENGINCLQFTDVNSVNATIAGVLKEKNIPISKWSEKHKQLYYGFYRQIVEYFRDRGIKDIIMMGYNEPNRKVIRERFLPEAELLSKLNVKLGASWTFGTFNELDLVKAIAPYAYWSCYTVVAPELKRLVDSGKIPLAPDTSCGFYIGSTPETRRPAEYGRSYGRYFFNLGQNFTYAHVGPFWKEWLYYGHSPLFGVWGQRLFAFGDSEEKTLLNCAFIEGVRDGLDDANLFYILEYYRNELASVKAARSAVERIDAAKARWIKELAFINHKRQSGDKPYEYVKVGKDLTPERAEYFKKELLDELMAIAPLVRKHVKPEINFRGIDLSDGAEISGGTLPGITHIDGAKTKIIFKIDPAMATDDFTVKSSGNTITLSGNNASALNTAVKAFYNVVDIKGAWLLDSAQ